MDKEKLEESIKNVEESIKTSQDNLEAAQHHIDEGNIILTALRAEL